MADLPFVLAKQHKTKTRYKWKSRGIIFQDEEHFVYIYNLYIKATNCDICNKLFPNSLNRHLDHCHNTGDVRNIMCSRCNIIRKDNKSYSTTGEYHIYKCKDTHYKLGYYCQVRIYRDGKYILRTQTKTLEEAIICRNKFIAENPDIFT